MKQISVFGDEYIENIKKIWSFTSPPINRYSSVEGLYLTFREQYRHAQKLSSDNAAFTRQEVFPLLEKQECLSEKEVESLEHLGSTLLEMDTLEFMDWILCFKIYEVLISDAKNKGIRKKIILHTAKMITLLYHICDILRRADSRQAREQQEHYIILAKSHIGDIIWWLEPDQFKKLDDEEKAAVLGSNRRKSLFYYPYPDNFQKVLRQRVECAVSALEHIRNPIYRGMVSEELLDQEEAGCIYYLGICSTVITIDDGTPENLLEIIYQACIEQKQRVLNGRYSYIDEFESSQLISFMDYIKGKINPMDYIVMISEKYLERDQNAFDLQGISDNVYRAVQILEVLVHHLDLEENRKYMEKIYRDLIEYAANMPNNEYQELFLTYMLLTLNYFREYSEELSFASLCQALLSGCSPSTYVHSRMVGLIASEMAGSLVKIHPESFLGVLDAVTVEQVQEKKQEIKQLLYQCGLFHDFGKLPYLDTIGITYRRLFDEEMDIIRLHPGAGYQLLSEYPSTRFYAMTAFGHHKWYNEKKGYPEDYHRNEDPYPILTDIIAVADCLDAATDIIFRSYNKGITLEKYIQEVKEFRGTRYAPEAADVFDDEELCEKLQKLLVEGREQVYLSAYKIKKRNYIES